MKKILLSIFALASYTSINAQCNELFISEYVEGTGNDKALEIYNPTNNPISLTGYRVERFSNGASTSSSGGVTNLTGTIAAHDVFVLVNGQTTTSGTSPACSPTLQAMADQLDGAYPAPTYMNGNDAIVLYKNTSIIDIFGMTGDAAMTSGYGWSDAFPYDGSAGTIWTENHTLIRKPGVTQGVTVNPSPEFIVTTQWDSLPVNTWDSLGTHTCSCLTGIHEMDNTVSVVIYPNPGNSGFVNVSAAEKISAIEIYNALGQQVMTLPGDKKTALNVETSALPKGIYTMRLSFADNRTSVQRISVQ
jgi:hypothetical protein